MNKSKLSKVCVLCAAGAMSAMVARAEAISSPSGNVSASVVVDVEGRLAHSVTMDGRVVLEPSPMGVTVDGRVVKGTANTLRRAGVTVTGTGAIQIGPPQGAVVIIR